MHCYQYTLVCSAKLHVMCTGASAMEMKMEADNDDVMEGLFTHYQTSAELQRGELNSDSLDSTNKYEYRSAVFAWCC